ncbi:hypothetical protein N7931_18940 [Catenovulum sp. 2E275]|uniref:hypothetical protein n=1 Tax=Catenovulum sp. 2E275 TaxID=2980497 RepID=UPI0021CF551C|nr:hypothetical protein [Catenovulum sp. 2E275]MCU4677691.1 hypothetical protein [Catenovulum sp. 2E275]
MNIKRTILILASLSLFTNPALSKPEHAKDNPQDLPPGLQKKYNKGKPLPPGWQKKLNRGDILDRDIYARGNVVVPLGQDGSITIEVDGTLLRLHEKTREIIDILQR